MNGGQSGGPWGGWNIQTPRNMLRGMARYWQAIPRPNGQRMTEYPCCNGSCSDIQTDRQTVSQTFLMVTLMKENGMYSMLRVRGSLVRVI